MYENNQQDASQLIVVRVDGGICSQIAFVSLGLCLSRAGHRVKYDLSWYRTWGKDVAGNQVRNWDFPVAFPEIPVEEASAAEIQAVRSRRVRVGSNIQTFSPPLYVGGYPERSDSIMSERRYLQKCFTPPIDEQTRLQLGAIRAGVSCAMHVRRGDLAAGNEYYGGATSIDYFFRTMQMVRGMAPEVRFFVFSDDPAWVKEVILPTAGDGVFMIEANGSDRGYVDLFLMAQCDYVISSVGSLGVMGALLSTRCRGLFMSHHRDWLSEGLKNVIYVNDDCGRRALPVEPSLLNGVPECLLHSWRGRLLRWWLRAGKALSGGSIVR